MLTLLVQVLKGDCKVDSCEVGETHRENRRENGALEDASPYSGACKMLKFGNKFGGN